ncbi:unnamed protein product [Amoebophrya sp. A25]|nr:unnamed protein product [Amoebophrya sp. A25]|eukprot:GSA25T00012748001.1
MLHPGDSLTIMDFSSGVPSMMFTGTLVLSHVSSGHAVVGCYTSKLSTANSEILQKPASKTAVDNRSAAAVAWSTSFKKKKRIAMSDGQEGFVIFFSIPFDRFVPCRIPSDTDPVKSGCLSKAMFDRVVTDKTAKMIESLCRDEPFPTKRRRVSVSGTKSSKSPVSETK